MANVVISQNLSEALEVKGGSYRIDGQCSRCGGCCTRFLPITRSEEKEIRRYVLKKHIPLERHGVDVDIDMLCPFLHFADDNTTSCSIYPIRPKICSLWNCNGWEEKKKSFLVAVGKRCANRPGLINNYDMCSILGKAPDSDKARLFLELKKFKERGDEK